MTDARSDGCDSGARLDGPVVDALYRGLLGRGPDPAGREHWMSCGSVEGLVDALVGTDEFERRAAERRGHARGTDVLLQMVSRLDHGRGVGRVTDFPPGVSMIDVLAAVPWQEIGDGLALSGIAVLGPYAAELANELGRRAGVGNVVNGMGADGLEVAPDVLVLTDPGYLDALAWSRPGLLASVRVRLLVPLLAAGGAPDDERQAIALARRTVLHGLGFAEVRHVFARRFSATLVHLDTSHVTPDPDPLVTTRCVLDAMALPAATWLIADRWPRSESDD
jgi:hypothetical protein